MGYGEVWQFRRGKHKEPFSGGKKGATIFSKGRNKFFPFGAILCTSVN
jgi:hypothetical protein